LYPIIIVGWKTTFCCSDSAIKSFQYEGLLHTYGNTKKFLLVNDLTVLFDHLITSLSLLNGPDKINFCHQI
jgi:hypothetical protein